MISRPYGLPYNRRRLIFIFWISTLSPVLMADTLLPEENILSLNEAIKLALIKEPGLTSQDWTIQSLKEKAIADSQLIEPKIQVGLLNLPTNTFKFNQEPMTQFKIGLIQQFPAGDTLALRQQKGIKKAERVTFKMAERRLMITKNIRLIYLEIYYWQQAKASIEKNKVLFSQLVDIVQSSYSLGRNNQQNLILSQLELNRLDDRMVKISQNINLQRVKLARWIGKNNSVRPLTNDTPQFDKLALRDDFESLKLRLITHPKILTLDKSIDISRNEINLVKESYKPSWNLNVSYSHRDNETNGLSRSDFISAIVTLDLPLFTAQRQDKKLSSRTYQKASLVDERKALLRIMITALQEQLVIQTQLERRLNIYKTLLLPQSSQQSETALLTYQSDSSDFSDVMKTYIDDLNINLDERRIAINLLKTKANILYFISGFSVNNMAVSVKKTPVN